MDISMWIGDYCLHKTLSENSSATKNTLYNSELVEVNVEMGRLLKCVTMSKKTAAGHGLGYTNSIAWSGYVCVSLVEYGRTN